jgi:hypothetical protein
MVDTCDGIKGNKWFQNEGFFGTFDGMMLNSI